MRRFGWLALPLLAALVAGCGESSALLPAPPPAAGAQRATLGWVERTGPAGTGFEFRVHRFEVTAAGWRADVSVRNETTASFLVARRSSTLADAFGIMLFGDGSHDELESRSERSTLPVVRPVRTVAPELPAALPPQATWSGTISAPGALPSGYWVRVVFGAFVPKDVMPESLRAEGASDELIWITDHAYRLTG
jgi:hypothetical protein